MGRTIIEKTILDMLIRSKIASMAGCERVEAMPVAWHAPNGPCCNWFVPGWLGDGGIVPRCAERMSPYLRYLQAEFDIPDEGPAISIRRPEDVG